LVVVRNPPDSKGERGVLVVAHQRDDVEQCDQAQPGGGLVVECVGKVSLLGQRVHHLPGQAFVG
jgi:hypothetical protein